MRNRSKYLLHMSGISLVDIGITGSYILISGDLAQSLVPIGLNIGILLVLNLVGAWLIYRPIARLEATTGSEAHALPAHVAHRITNLPLVSAAWAAFLGLLYCVAISLFGGFEAENPARAAIELDNPLLYIAIFAFAYCSYFSFYAFFAAANFGMGLRDDLSRRVGWTSTVTGPRMKTVLAIAFLGLVLPPIVLVIADLTVLENLRTRQGFSLKEAILLDLAGTLIAGAMAFFFLARLLTLPTERLLSAVNRVSEEHYDAPTPVLVDHEIGALSENFGHMAQGLAEKARLRRIFALYVSEPIVRAILASEESADGRLKGSIHHATVIFTDIEDFSSLTVELSPDQLVDTLNRYFEAISAPVQRNGGVVINYIGDAMMATFNVPVPSPAHARRALEVANEIQRITAREDFGAGRMLKTRIGIHTGQVIAGTVGGLDRLGFTLYGDTVNTAARLERANKDFGTYVLVSEATKRHADQHRGDGDGAEDMRFRALGPCEIRGLPERVQVFSPEGTAPAVSDQTPPRLPRLPGQSIGRNAP
ncbi:MAG: HAMP domain-containing protein [Alphaproteobacteria bacterium]|nr:HAMP domain-containing protein [Alphaproteobacteria bacterium]